jgi:chromosomal replication initiation ATPase DnaA
MTLREIEHDLKSYVREKYGDMNIQVAVYHNDIDYSSIIQLVCEINGITRADFVSRSRKREIVEARAMFVSFIRSINSRISLQTLGKLIGSRDHTTVINALKKHRDTYIYDKAYKLKYQNLVNQIKL